MWGRTENPTENQTENETENWTENETENWTENWMGNEMGVDLIGSDCRAVPNSLVCRSNGPKSTSCTCIRIHLSVQV